MYMNKPLVSIRCATYNHAPYIRQCLDGFVMQKTNFCFEAIVHDDASTDGTADIIREYAEKYPDIIKPIYETENQYSKHDGSLARIMNAHMHGKYIAFCEGDDYWTDPLKLQKQVNFLEGNPEYGLVYTKAISFYQTLNQMKNVIGGCGTSFLDILYYNPIPTLTTCFRSDLYKSYIDEILPFSYSWKMGDYPLWIYLSQKSKVKFMDTITGVYRILHDSASHCPDIEKQLALYDSGFDIALFFQDRYLKDRVDIKYHFEKERLWFHFRLFCIKKEWTRIKLMKNDLAKLKSTDLKTRIMKAACRFLPLGVFMSAFFRFQS